MALQPERLVLLRDDGDATQATRACNTNRQSAVLTIFSPTREKRDGFDLELRKTRPSLAV